MMFSHRLQKTIHVNLNVFGAATNIALVFGNAQWLLKFDGAALLSAQRQPQLLSTGCAEFSTTGARTLMFDTVPTMFYALDRLGTGL